MSTLLSLPLGAPFRKGLVVPTRIVVLTFFLAATACSGSGPEGNAKRWLDALNDGEVTTAHNLSTPQTQALLQMASAFGEDLAVGEYRIVSVKEVSKNRAEVVVEAKDETTTLDMTKIDGEWKVGIKK